MFMVGGGILLHGIPGTHEISQHLTEPLRGLPLVGGTMSAFMPTILGATIGVLAGGLLWLCSRSVLTKEFCLFAKRILTG